jgi:hypothetical protein
MLPAGHFGYNGRVKRNTGLTHLLLVVCVISLASWGTMRADEATPSSGARDVSTKPTPSAESEAGFNIGGIRLGMTTQGVLALLGRPVQRRKAEYLNAQDSFRLILTQCNYDFGRIEWMYGRSNPKGVHELTVGSNGRVSRVQGDSLYRGAERVLGLGDTPERVRLTLGRPHGILRVNRGNYTYKSIEREVVNIRMSRVDPNVVQRINLRWLP